ncbi:MAG: hypothetical protein WD768_23280 [Phycisphaeraceae bacterium]
MSKRNRKKKQRERHQAQPKEPDTYMLVRRGLVQRTFASVGGFQKKIWPVAESMPNARKLAAFLKCDSDVVPARIGSMPDETMQGHVRLAIKEQCQLIVCVAGWEADGSPKWKTRNLEKSWQWTWSDPTEEFDLFPTREPDCNVNDIPPISIDALFGEGLEPNLSAANDPRLQLRLADLIFAVDIMSEENMLVYGHEWLEQITSSNESSTAAVLRVAIDKDTDDLEKLIALIQVVKGESD